MQGEYLNYKMLSVMMRLVHILIIFFRSRVPLNPNYSRLARTSLTVTTERFNCYSEGQSLLGPFHTPKLGRSEFK